MTGRKLFILVVAAGVGAYVASILSSTLGALASTSSDAGVVAMFVLGVLAIATVATGLWRLVNPNQKSKKGTRKNA